MSILVLVTQVLRAIEGVACLNHRTEVTLDVLAFSCVPRTVFQKAFQGSEVVYGSSKIVIFYIEF